MPSPRRRPAIAASRRTTLAVTPLLVVAGCRWGPPDDTPSQPEVEPDADATLVTQAATAIRSTQALLARVGAQHPALVSPLAALTGVHVAHLALLVGDDSGPSPSATGSTGTTAVPGVPGAALALVRADETALQARLAELAGSATSGTFARALASMSASVAQHLAVLPAAVA